MNTADIISLYLNNEMTPDQERQFLLSVAASDQLRLALKSHVMLDHVILRQAQELQVPFGVRSAILAEATAVLMTPAPKAPASAGPVGVQRPSGRSLMNGVMMAGIAAALFVGGYFTRVGLLEPDGGENAWPAVTQTVTTERAPNSPGATLPPMSLDSAALEAVVGTDAARPHGSQMRPEVAAVPLERESVAQRRAAAHRSVNQGEISKSTNAVIDRDNPLNASTDVLRELKESGMIAQPESTGLARTKLDQIGGPGTITIDGSIRSSRNAHDGGQQPSSP